VVGTPVVIEVVGLVLVVVEVEELVLVVVEEEATMNVTCTDWLVTLPDLAWTLTVVDTLIGELRVNRDVAFPVESVTTEDGIG